jgi:putative oxidoreductase
MGFIFKTDDSWSSLILRVTLGVVLFPHGAQKLLGWYGGGGFSGTMGFFTAHMHIPWILAFLVILFESIGAVALIAGFLTRLMALGMACIMVGAVYLVHWPFGFFMNWFGKQPGEGYEYHLLAFGISLALMVAGGGKGSVDGWIDRRMES